MSSDVDLRELAIDRSENRPSSSRPLGIQRRRHVMTRYVLPLTLIVGFLSLVAWAASDLIFPATLVMDIPVVSTASEIHQEGAPLFKAAGWIEPRPTPVRVAALAPGVVEKLLVVEDQAVLAGEPIAELIKDDARLAYRRALADVDLRQAEIDAANAVFIAAEAQLKQPVHLEASLNEAEAILAQADTQLKSLPFEIRRAEAEHRARKRNFDGKTSARNVIAENKISIAESEADAAKALLEGLHARVDSLKQEQHALTQRRNALRTQLELLANETQAKDEAQAKIKAAQARFEQARVAEAEAKLRLDRMTVVAPVDGRIFRLIAHPGARIGSGMTQLEDHDGSTVVTMYRPERLQVRVDVRFEDIPKISLKQPVEINNPALAAPLSGDVLFISSEADIQKNTLQVKVGIPDPSAVLKPEMLVDITFLAPRQPARATESARAVRIYVPQQLIHQDDGGAYVWRADRSEGVARKTTIQTGVVASNGLVEITHGLNVSSRLITNGSERLQDGDTIKVTGEDSSIGEFGATQQNRGYLDPVEQPRRGADR